MMKYIISWVFMILHMEILHQYCSHYMSGTCAESIKREHRRGHVKCVRCYSQCMWASLARRFYEWSLCRESSDICTSVHDFPPEKDMAKYVITLYGLYFLKHAGCIDSDVRPSQRLSSNQIYNLTLALRWLWWPQKQQIDGSNKQ